jgi:hypothetical protein
LYFAAKFPQGFVPVAEKVTVAVAYLVFVMSYFGAIRISIGTMTCSVLSQCRADIFNYAQMSKKI